MVYVLLSYIFLFVINGKLFLSFFLFFFIYFFLLLLLLLLFFFGWVFYCALCSLISFPWLYLQNNRLISFSILGSAKNSLQLLIELASCFRLLPTLFSQIKANSFWFCYCYNLVAISVNSHGYNELIELL